MRNHTVDRFSILEELGNGDIAPHVKRSDIVYRHMRDPALLRYYYKLKMQPLTSKLELIGSSPTDLFIGRFGYPKVSIGPLVPPEFGDTSILGMPERWRPMGIDQIVEMRSKLVRGTYLTNVKNVEKGRVEEFVRDLALADKPAEADVRFASRPTAKLALQDEVQPFGPTAAMKDFDLYNVSADKKIESRHSDTDAKAGDAMVELYNRGVPVSKIQRGLSAGLFGMKNLRKFVPTRWSITAVDDTLSKSNLEIVKSYDTLDAIYAYYNVALDNRWLIFFIPGNWQYESIEAWYPHTIWNENGKDASIFSSYEGYKGRKYYAEIGGCYYSGRLAVTEAMLGLKKQAMALILREVHEGYLMPVGVWNVREHVRETLEAAPTVLHGMNEMLDFIKTKLEIRTQDWISNSDILTDMLMQKRLVDYVGAR